MVKKRYTILSDLSIFALTPSCQELLDSTSSQRYNHSSNVYTKQYMLPIFLRSDYIIHMQCILH